MNVVADWIAEVEQERRAIERDLSRTPISRKLTKNEVRALILRLKEITAVLSEAEPEDSGPTTPSWGEPHLPARWDGPGQDRWAPRRPGPLRVPTACS